MDSYDNFLDGYLAEQEAERAKLSDSFTEGYKREQNLDALSNCPPWPASTKVAAEARTNYATINGNTPAYGLTGLMAVNTWQTTCYGQIRPGYIWLFPGTYSSNPPAYSGTVSLDCKQRPPLSPSNRTLHAAMCAGLGKPASNFIGFAIGAYPYSTQGAVHYNSCTCNPHWFGSCAISQNCDGHDWQNLLNSTLQTWL